MVKNLVSKVQPHGEHLVRWNGTDDNGKSVAAGVYFCRLDASDFNRTVKVILLK
jgi:flagellar hook assembly protein FlgD